MKSHPPNLRNSKIKVITLPQLERLSKRLDGILQFNLIGAVLCLTAGLYYANQGSQLLPVVFLVVLAISLSLVLLSFRASHRVQRLMQLIEKKK